ncbi:uncharacterized protein TRAVEDRAFT_42625 [Trametes versicolor FP-101664 SS1]|uniref:uncharacterized protein n=1 Tax=Trametes versicolor (strain FP-101664) TaxID=717944 RepID=UPI00046215A0|nr:uncharacterized protein TRAVEDRAFT_42625 [Trametes versicolor FP-101664 SS1]EIW65247.1 hypothetical protein TRAVEDRAFT_42625 [Trametes versicolor FP-101664 SS1]
MAPPVAPLPGPSAPRTTMLSITDMLCDTAPEKPAPKKPAGSGTYRKSATQRDGVPPLTREELGKLEFQEGTAVRVNTLRFDGPGDVPRLRRGSIAPFAKYPPSLERHYYLPSGKLCHRYMVIMDDTRAVMGPFCTALGEILLASGLMSAKLDAA